MVAPFPLELPERSAKPRRVGLTHVLDKGLTPGQVADLLSTCGRYVDGWKFGWGTAYVDPLVEAKLALLGRHGVLGCLGGTLLEVAWANGGPTTSSTGPRGRAFPAWRCPGGPPS